VKRTQRARGAAAVEMAITMVLLIPLIFFALFLEDFVFYKLEGQEPVIAAAWDHITPDYMRSNPDDGSMNRLKYCDHTAAYDSYERDFECDGAGGGASGGPSQQITGATPDLGHHHATGAHACWIGGGQQVRCDVSKGVDATMLPAAKPFMMFFATNWNRGGIATCSAQLNVFNWIIPQNISKEGGWLWSKGNKNSQLTSKTQFGAGSGQSVAGQREWNESYAFKGVHDDAEKMDSGGMGNWLLAKEEFSLLIDPWALTDIPDVGVHEGIFGEGTGALTLTTFLAPGTIPGMDLYHPLLDRTGNYYNHYASSAADKAMDWQSAMKDKELLDTFSGYDIAGDEMHSVPVYWAKAKPRSHASGYASGYKDSRAQQANRPSKFPPTWGPQSSP